MEPISNIVECTLWGHFTQKKGYISHSIDIWMVPKYPKSLQITLILFRVERVLLPKLFDWNSFSIFLFNNQGVFPVL